MTAYRLVIQDVTGAEVMASYTRWIECVQVKEGKAVERRKKLLFNLGSRRTQVHDPRHRKVGQSPKGADRNTVEVSR
jgi:hypothetical protein